MASLRLLLLLFAVVRTRACLFEVDIEEAEVEEGREIKRREEKKLVVFDCLEKERGKHKGMFGTL